MLPIFPLAKNVLSICRQNSPSIESNNNHYTKNILAILARKCAEIRWLQKIAVIWLQIFEGSYFAKTSPRFQNSGELFCHFQDLIFFSGELFCHPGELFCGGAILPSRGAILLHRTWRSKRYVFEPKCRFPNESQKVKKIRTLICFIWELYNFG